ncbi:4-(cytidine 5'-diphospho)-2-C-methyl-D-erythritol kinase [Reichenbachiella sp.]|uniref:4-(cytidine 5'-diphospho)-2-C-methyl-D-erythritol kinase n=1 Tax=Reichenbachiella sp. TaxID=2184521 RepID=UPI003296EF80
MIAFPNAKINIGLNITSKRTDGYHNLSSCFLPLGWKDALEIVPADEFVFTSSGLDIPEDGSTNLCVRAYELLKEKHDIPPVKMHLHKVVPMGAGLGGGSADGAFALKLLNEQFEIGLTKVELEAYAITLGADCPFFIDNQPKLVTGVGEILEDIVLDLSDYLVVAVFPGIHVNTRVAFDGITPKEPGYDIKSALQQPPKDWQGAVVNDFEKTVFAAHPELQSIKLKLLELGADYASMTGTGSAVYGIFDRSTDFETALHDFDSPKVQIKSLELNLS